MNGMIYGIKKNPATEMIKNSRTVIFMMPFAFRSANKASSFFFFENKGRNTLLKPPEIMATTSVINEKAYTYPSVSALAPNWKEMIFSRINPEVLRSKASNVIQMAVFFRLDKSAPLFY